MADKTYVEIAKFTVKDIYEDAQKGKAIDLMGSGAEAAVKKSGKLTTDTPKDKKTKGWFLLGNLVSLGPDKAGTKFAAKVSLTIATWPDKSMKSFPSGEAAFAIAKDEKVSASDALSLVKTAAAEAMKSAVPFMETKKPE